MSPDASKYNPSPEYLRELIAQTGMTQSDVARCIGIGGRSIRRHLADVNAATYSPAPYVVQFAIESLAAAKIS